MNSKKWAWTSLLIIVIGLLAIAGCTGAEKRAVDGDTVSVNFTGTLSDGSIFETTTGGQPYTFTIGTSQVLPDFDKTVLGMAVGEERTVMIPFDEAYGPYREDFIIPVERESFPEDLAVVGTAVMIPLEDGQVARGTVIGVDETTVILDLNHHLAGEDLTFTISLVQIL
ncbi:peptidylprolyl isomerase [Methanocalculus sp.]|uniref:FKBP-type peptidyl-prolyl cis-trans isomerase n=1 Tax=Methanocalculus sp. TaxID=2004547 RepID=UPI002725D6E3|nr:FKBP-type peptidyl-prolyl cis-trans isomerase [Methanocalculus sp.]MDO8841117.1 FKBP-type peptidyl-prolyl cis-trans isomerase [Methanocalculus sp.]